MNSFRCLLVFVRKTYTIRQGIRHSVKTPFTSRYLLLRAMEEWYSEQQKMPKKVPIAVSMERIIVYVFPALNL